MNSLEDKIADARIADDAKTEGELMKALNVMAEERSQLRSCAPFEIELAEVRFEAGEVPSICAVAGSGQYTKDTKGSELRIFYCGDLIVFERPGEPAESVPFAKVQRMTALADAQGIAEKRLAIMLKKKAVAEAGQKLEKARKIEEAEAYSKAKAAQVVAKQQNKNFVPRTEVVPVRLETVEEDAAGDAAADMAATTPAEVSAVTAEMSGAPVPAVVDQKEMESDMRAERGTMSDEEQRSMQAAVARSKRGRR